MICHIRALSGHALVFPLAVVIFLFGLAIEGHSLLSLYAFFGQRESSISRVLTGHLMAVCLTSLALLIMLPQKENKDRLWIFVSLFFFGLFVPLVSHVGLFVVVLVKLRSGGKGRVSEPTGWRFTAKPPLPSHSPVIFEKEKYGLHGMISRLKHTTSAKELLAIVLATRFMKDEHGIPLLKSALSNPEDDIRLLAFSLLEKKNTEINNAIEALKTNLEKDKNKGQVYVAIAQNYLQMVTLGVVQEEMKSQVLAKAQKHLQSALEENPDDRNALFFLGKIKLLEQPASQEAEQLLNRALLNGFAASEIYPLLAESAFQQKHFQKIPDYLLAIPEERRKYPPLRHIADFWLH